MRHTRLLLVCLCLVGADLSAQDRLPVPTSAAQHQAERLLRGAYKAAYASKFSTEKLALAKTLLLRARSRQDDAAGQFAAYQEARALAVQVWNIELAIAVARECATRFDLSAYSMVAEVLAAAAKVPHGQAENRILTQVTIGIAVEAAAAEDVDSAGRLIAVAANLAQALKEAPLLAAVAARSKEIADLRVWLGRVRNAAATLGRQPDDAAAHAILGEHEALRHANWELGLEHLCNGADADLQALALRDRSNSVATDEQVALAGTWWDLGEQRAGLARLNARQRALFWYEKAGGGTVPMLDKARMADRLPALRVERLTRGDWLAADAPSAYEFDRYAAFDAGCIDIRPGSKDLSFADLTKLSGEFDGVSVRVRLDDAASVQAYVVYEKDQQCLLYDGAQGLLAAAWQRKDHCWVHHCGCQPRDPQAMFLAVLLRGEEAVVYVDGVELGLVPTKQRVLNAVSLQASAGRVRFDQVQMHRKAW